MFLTEKIEKAIVRATLLHASQKRKVSGVPYIVHPYAVAFLLAHYSNDEDVIIAGLLHDVLEDVPQYTEQDMRAEFGERVLAIVKEVTEDFTPAEKEDHRLREHNEESWRARKEKYLENLRNASEEALMVAAADKIHNMHGIIDEYRIHGVGVWEKFKRPPAKQLWFYNAAAKAISEKLEHPLVEEMQKVLAELRSLIE